MPRRDESGRNDTPNYGGAHEKRIRTTRSGAATFEGRDYERENYGGGHGRRPKREWRGQAAGTGLDGLASERAFGSDSNEQMSRSDSDGVYRRWRAARLRAHDDDYRAWRRAQEARLDEDYARWKAQRNRV